MYTFLKGICLRLLKYYSLVLTFLSNMECSRKLHAPSTEDSSHVFTVEELRQYNGVNNDRILLAVNGIVCDVTSGKVHYGPGRILFV